MSSRRTVWIVVGVVAFAALVVAAMPSVIGLVFKQTADRSWELPTDLDEVIVRADVGDLEVRVAEPGTPPRVTAESTWSLRRPSSEVVTEGGSTTVTTDCPPMTSGRCSVDLTLVVPADADLDVQLDVGGAEVCDLTGDVSVKVDVGDVKLCRGASARTTLEADTGSVDAEFDRAPDELEMRTDVGDIKVQLPKDASYFVSAQASVGEIDNSVANDPASEHVVVATTDVGDIRLR